jgi:hypothetical protein
MTYRSQLSLVGIIVVGALACMFPDRSTGLAQMMAEKTSLQTSTTVREAFKNPPAGYRSAPLWVWNDRITPGEIDDGLADLQRHGIGGVFIHPRPGLITPYLSQEWLSLCRHAVESGKRLGMKIWIYDENSYPSGFAGGHVPAQMPEARRTGLKMIRATQLPVQLTPEPLLILAKDSTGFSDITPRFKGGSFGPGDYRIFTLVREKPRPWYGGFTYVDLMQPEVTRRFIDVTMNAYKRAFGDEFGNVVPGVFQDEAEISPASEPEALVINYTPALFDRFFEKCGYDLKPCLPSMYEEIGDWRRVRHDFYSTILQLFIEGWAKPYYDYCTANHLQLTGHYWEHEWPRPVVNPDNMATVAYSQMPGIDILMNDFQMDVHAQFGNARSVKEIRSVANQLGRERTLSETFGAGGWDMSFADQKRIADWEYALGVNFMNQHLSYVTITGARKRDHPLSFSYHEPWWKHYRLLADYFGRLSVALCSGEQRNRILVLEPTTTAWMYSGAQWKNDHLDTLGKTFQDFVHRLEAAQVEYDLGSEDILRNHAKIQDRQLVVGQRAYDLIVLPPGLQNIEETTFTLLQNYLANGGTLVCCGATPGFVSGRRSDRVNSLSANSGPRWVSVREEDVLKTITRLSPPVLVFRDSSSAPSPFPLLFHHRRSLDDCEILFLANTDSGAYRSGEFLAHWGSCEKWDPFTGISTPYPSVAQGDRIIIGFSLPPGGSLLLCLRAGPQTAHPPKPESWSNIPSREGTVVRRQKPNVLTLDYCDLTIGGNTQKDLYFYQAQQKAYQHHGLERNPWDNAVQFKTTILDRDSFDPGSGFEATFRCTLADGVDHTSLRAVVERPEIFRVSVNGKPARSLKGQWWLDKAFGVFDIGQLVKKGENTITVASSPFTIHSELEPIYILGDFSLESRERGFRILPAGELRTGSWNELGMPFYADGVSYTKSFDLAAGQIKSRRFVIRLGRWRGVIAGVTVNNREAGTIAFAPYELDVTKALKPGTNSVTVTVYGSLKNTLGPHHNNPLLGRAWPSQFQEGAKEGRSPGSEYSNVGYGLFEDFVLRSSHGQ